MFFDLRHIVWINHLILKNTCLGRSLFFARELALFFVDYISGYDIKLDFVKTIEHHTNWMYGHIHACVPHNLSMYSVTMGKKHELHLPAMIEPVYSDCQINVSLTDATTYGLHSNILWIDWEYTSHNGDIKLVKW